MKRLRRSCASLLVLPFFLACGEDNAAIPSPSPSPSSSPSASTAGNSVHGTIGGKAFVPKSALVHAGRGYVHGEVDAPALTLIFSSAPDVCSTAKQDHFLAGETYVTFYGVRAAVGTDTVDDADVFVVDATCPSGTRLDKDNAPTTSALGVSKGVTVTVTRLDAELVEGTVSAKFEDLSTFEGSFSLVPCAGSSGFGESPVCP